jgi:hypothetical protein
MADELVRTFYGATADMEPATLCAPVVEPVFVFGQILESGFDLLAGFRRSCFHAFDSCQDMSLLIMEKAR